MERCYWVTTAGWESLKTLFLLRHALQSIWLVRFAQVALTVKSFSDCLSWLLNSCILCSAQPGCPPSLLDLGWLSHLLWGEAQGLFSAQRYTQLSPAKSSDPWHNLLSNCVHPLWYRADCLYVTAIYYSWDLQAYLTMRSCSTRPTFRPARHLLTDSTQVSGLASQISEILYVISKDAHRDQKWTCHRASIRCPENTLLWDICKPIFTQAGEDLLPYRSVTFDRQRIVHARPCYHEMICWECLSLWHILSDLQGPKSERGDTDMRGCNSETQKLEKTHRSSPGDKSSFALNRSLEPNEVAIVCQMKRPTVANS